MAVANSCWATARIIHRMNTNIVCWCQGKDDCSQAISSLEPAAAGPLGHWVSGSAVARVLITHHTRPSHSRYLPTIHRFLLHRPQPLFVPAVRNQQPPLRRSEHLRPWPAVPRPRPPTWKLLR